MLLGDRFTSRLDECVHILIAVYMADVYDTQILDLIDSYGIDLIEQACNIVLNDYKLLLERIE